MSCRTIIGLSAVSIGLSGFWSSPVGNHWYILLKHVAISVELFMRDYDPELNLQMRNGNRHRTERSLTQRVE